MSDKVRVCKYFSPVGMILLASNGQALVGSWFVGQKYYASVIQGKDVIHKRDAVLRQASSWLEEYFMGNQPQISDVPLELCGTMFQCLVWRSLCLIPSGHVATYQEIGRQVKGLKYGANYARATAQAVGHNPLSLFVPCHRIIGSNGSLTGYAGGIRRKKKLLEFEKALAPDFWQLSEHVPVV